MPMQTGQAKPAGASVRTDTTRQRVFLTFAAGDLALARPVDRPPADRRRHLPRPGADQRALRERPRGHHPRQPPDPAAPLHQRPLPVRGAHLGRRLGALGAGDGRRAQPPPARRCAARRGGARLRALPHAPRRRAGPAEPRRHRHADARLLRRAVPRGRSTQPPSRRRCTSCGTRSASSTSRVRQPPVIITAALTGSRISQGADAGHPHHPGRRSPPRASPRGGPAPASCTCTCATPPPARAPRTWTPSARWSTPCAPRPTSSSASPPAASPGRNLPTAERIAPLALQPEMASFDAGTIQMDAGLFVNEPEFLDALAAEALARGVKLELECFDLEMVHTALRYHARGQDPGAAALPVRHRHAARDAGDRRRRWSPPSDLLPEDVHLVGDRRRAHADAHGDAGAGHGRARARRARGQHPLPPRRARDRQRPARRARGAAGGRAGTAGGDAGRRRASCSGCA